MQGLKFLVIFLGVLIVLGLGGLVYGIATKAGKLGDSSGPVETTEIALPADGRVVEMVPGEGRLYVRYARPDGTEAILILDDRGRKVGFVDLRADGDDAGSGEGAAQ